MLGDKKTWQCLDRIVLGCGFLVHRLGCSCELESNVINFIIWTGMGKNCTCIKRLSMSGLLSGLHNASVAGISQ